MNRQHLDYDQIAPDYDRRFASGSRSGRLEALRRLAAGRGTIAHQTSRRILDVGCGTAFWLDQLLPSGGTLIGLDRSAGMLRVAQGRHSPLALVLGSAHHLPLREQTLDVVFCVNAIHHFAEPQRFVAEAFRVLRRGGTLGVLGSDPRRRLDSWYVYDYFAGTFQTDLSRFPAWGTVEAWMTAIGFTDLKLEVVERISDHKAGRAILDDPYLKKNACSQLALLSEEAYADGLQRIRGAVIDAEEQGVEITFRCELAIGMITGTRP